MKCPKDMPKISDVDWAASDRPALACTDGTVRIMDLKFSQGSSPLEDGQLAGMNKLGHFYFCKFYKIKAFILLLGQCI